jgi:hypothetical protein
MTIPPAITERYPPLALEETVEFVRRFDEEGADG